MSEPIPYDDDSFEPDDPPLIPAFTLVPRKTQRVHGWSPERQRAFIEALADTGSVTDAAKRVNMTPEAAYYLRRAEGAASFRAAWEAAVEIGGRSLCDLAIDRVRNGNVVTRYEKGEVVSEKRWHDNRLLMFMLRRHEPERYGRNASLSPGGRANFGDDAADADEAREEIMRMVSAARRAQNEETYAAYRGDAAKRAAWELLNGKPLEALLGEEEPRLEHGSEGPVG